MHHYIRVEIDAIVKMNKWKMSLHSRQTVRLEKKVFYFKLDVEKEKFDIRLSVKYIYTIFFM